MSYNAPPPPYSVLHDIAPPSLFDSLKQSLTSLTMSPSKIQLEILPIDSLDMIGKPDKETAYSLSGQVVVRLVPPSGWFCDAPPVDERFLLESLVVTFEGQSELVTSQTGYASCHLIELSQELLTDGPVEITHSWNEDGSRNPEMWCGVFNLTVPGWLPASCHTSFIDPAQDEPEVSYRLSAVARYRDDKPKSPLSWKTACYGYMNISSMQSSIAKAPIVDVTINRYTIPPTQFLLTGSEFTDVSFRSLEMAGTISEDDVMHIPRGVLSQLELRMSVPEHIPIDAGSFPIMLKVRPNKMSMDDRKRLHLPRFVVTATQNEILRSSMSNHYAEKWPVPLPPEGKPVRSRRQDTREYECGLILGPPTGTCATRSHSLISPEFPERIELEGDDLAKASFADQQFERDDTWVHIRIDVPIREILIDKRRLSKYDNRPVPKLRPSELGPLLSVYHTLCLTLTVSYELPEGSSTGPSCVSDDLRFDAPLSFVHVPPSAPPCSTVASASDSDAQHSVVGLAGSIIKLPESSQPYAHSLPAYNQLYHKNGTRREDPTPLPRYTPKGGQEENPEGPPPPPTLTVCVQTPSHKATAESTSSSAPLTV